MIANLQANHVEARQPRADGIEDHVEIRAMILMCMKRRRDEAEDGDRNRRERPAQLVRKRRS